MWRIALLLIRKQTILAALIVVLFSQAALAQDNDLELLRGVQEIGLLVDASEKVARHGLSAAELQIDAERRLRKAGIAAFPAKDVVLTETDVYLRPFLYLHLNAVQSDRDPDIYALCITVEFRQEATLISRGRQRPALKVPPFLTTWEQGRVALFNVRALSSLRMDISELVDQFISDYRAVNPPRR
jgi:hypothetical protein